MRNTEPAGIAHLLEEGTWEGEDTPRLLLVATSGSSGRVASETLEAWLSAYGFVGATNDSTSPAYHQVIGGIEGWEINLLERTYTRLDDFTVKWKRFSHGENIPVCSLAQLELMLRERPGQVASLRYGV